MPRYIDANKLVEILNETQDDINPNNYYKGLGLAKRIVSEMPTEDVIPRDAVEIYGYPAKELVLFATLCRDEGITVAEIREINDIVKTTYELVGNEFESRLKEVLKRYANEYYLIDKLRKSYQEVEVELAIKCQDKEIVKTEEEEYEETSIN